MSKYTIFAAPLPAAGVFFLLVLSISSCNTQNDSIDGKIAELEKLRAAYQTMGTEIRNLEQEILALNPNALDAPISATPITAMVIEAKPFSHFVTVRGNVESRSNVLVSAEMMGRVVRSHVKEGDRVQRGQRILSLDGAVLENNKAELITSLDLAQSVFDRQARLWEQNIGTEVQYLQAKNNVESLKRRLETLDSEMDKLEIRAPFTGTIDKLLVLEGEMVSPGTPVARFTGNTDMYINAEVSERFIGRFEVGDPVQVMFPNLNESFESKISAIGNTLNANNRTFSVEIRLAPGMENIKANMIATVRLQDYYNPEAISIPANLIMKDRIGPYVWRLVEEEGLPRAHKVYIKTGDLSDQMIEIIEGLELGNRIVDKGYRDMNEGMVVRIAAN